MVKYKSTSGALPQFPKDILYIGNLQELKEISITGEWIKIGSMVKLSTLLEERRLPDYIKIPVKGIGSPSIRNLGTMGGNICNASPAGDTLPMLYALDVAIELSSAKGTRKVGIQDFIKGPGKTDIKPNEIMTGIFIKRTEFNRWGYRKVGARKANAISKLSVFCTAQIDQSSVRDIRISFGSVGPTVIRNREIEKEIVQIGVARLKQELGGILEAYADMLSPISDVRSTKDYRKDVSLNILKEIIEGDLIL
ncbi:FAD binding domain-containing protein [Gudongella sp. SC589]|uniref:FAD binding domain-containing protein n=1 Tax=Gudongella sp. SC589 TaxID=3385990 RepID=UPI0039047A3F